MIGSKRRSLLVLSFFVQFKVERQFKLQSTRAYRRCGVSNQRLMAVALAIWYLPLHLMSVLMQCTVCTCAHTHSRSHSLTHTLSLKPSHMHTNVCTHTCINRQTRERGSNRCGASSSLTHTRTRAQVSTHEDGKCLLTVWRCVHKALEFK